MKKRVLNVDDDEAGRYAMSRVLRQADFDVKEAANGEQALKMAVEDRPDLILLDIHLPDIDGFEVCRRLKADAETSTIPVVYITASYVEINHRTRGLDEGADGYLVEPVDPGFLIASVKSMLRIRDAEREVRKYARAWQATFDSIQDGIAVLDSEGAVIQSNCRFRDLFSDSEFDKVLQANGGRPATLTQPKWEVKRGEECLELSFNPIENSFATKGAICVVRDVTERNRIEENLRFTQKLESVGLLAGGIAHDFNNLLTGILGNASLALDEPSLPPALRPMLQQVVTSSERAADLTRQLLAYAGKGRFFEEPIDVSAMVRETLSLIRTSLLAHEVRLILSPALPQIRADATQLRQLMMNLILNASEAIGQSGGSISITTTVLRLDKDGVALFPKYSLEPGSYVSLEVQDTGMGMDEDTIERIFDPFFTTKFFGRGLGLSATLGIVRAHHGAIRVVSAPGEGALFHVVLPAREIRDENPPVPTLDPEAVTGKILIVEDEESVRSMMHSVLERDGHTVVMAVNGSDAVKLYKAHRMTIDLVIVDLTMPVMGGEDTIRALMNIDPDVGILVCTGHSTTEAAEMAGAPVLGVLAKPFRGSLLRAEVRKYLLQRLQAAS